MLCVCTCHIAKKIFSQILSRTSFKIHLRVGSEHTHESEVARDNQMHGRLFYAISSVELLEVCFCNACVQAGLQHAYLAHVEVCVTATYIPQPEPEEPPCYGPWTCACLCPCLCLYLCLSMHMPNVFQNKHTALVSSTTLHSTCIMDSMASGESCRACRF